MTAEKQDGAPVPLRGTGFGYDSFKGNADVPDLPYLSFAYSYLQSDIHEKSLLTKEEDDDEDEDDASKCESTNSDGDGKSSVTSVPSYARAMVPYAAPQCLDNELIWKAVASYCNLNDLKALRLVSTKALAATQSIARFDPSAQAVFIPLPSAVIECKSVCNEEHPDWTCRLCHTQNRFTSLRCSTPNCNSTRPYSSTNTPSSNGLNPTRIFCGQLRKDSTVACVLWVMSMTSDKRFEIGRVEAHTNAQDNRGKGCAWVHLYDEESIAKLIKLDHRVFFDYDEATGEEGVWICANTDDAKERLAELSRRLVRNRPVVLPRGPIVVEFPNSLARRKDATARATRFTRGSDRADRAEDASHPFRSAEKAYSRSAMPASNHTARHFGRGHSQYEYDEHNPYGYMYPCDSYVSAPTSQPYQSIPSGYVPHGQHYTSYATQPYPGHSVLMHNPYQPVSYHPSPYQQAPYQQNPYVVVQQPAPMPMYQSYTGSNGHHSGCPCSSCSHH